MRSRPVAVGLAAMLVAFAATFVLADLLGVEPALRFALAAGVAGLTAGSTVLFRQP